MEQSSFWDVLVPFIKKILELVSTDYGDIISNTYLAASRYIGKVEPIAEALMPLAIGLLVVRWAVSLLQDILTMEIDLEIIMRSFMRLVVAAMIVTNAIPITKGVIEFGDALIADMNAEAIFGPLSYDIAIFDNIVNLSKQANSDASVTGVIGVISALIIAYIQPIISAIVAFFLYVHGWQRSISITQTFIYAPIAISDCFRGGINSGAVRYLRKMLALVVEPLIIYAAVSAYVLFSTQAGDLAATMGDAGPFFLPWMQFVLVLAMISFIRKGDKFAEEIFA